MNSTLDASAHGRMPEALTHLRTSEVLRSILTRNPDVQLFSVEQIVASLGEERAEAALMLFSVPTFVPLDVPNGATCVPTGVIGSRLACGRRQLRLPGYILRKQISRRALAIAIHAAVPVLEAAERLVRPRWHWINHPISRRAIGLLIFLLAVAIAYPLSGSGALHALSIFVMSLGLAEADGLTILIGVVAGVLSLAVVVVTGFSPRVLRRKLSRALRKLARKLGLSALARFLDRMGFPRLARLLTVEWSDVVMHWDPEKPRPENVNARDGAHASDAAACPPPPPQAYPALAHAAHR